MTKPPEERELPPFKPPKPDLHTGLLYSFEIERDLFTKDSFQAALKRTFIAAGQAPLHGGTFAVYTSHARNRIAANLLPAGKAEDTSLATMFGHVDVANCDDDDEPETDEEGAEEGAEDA